MFVQLILAEVELICVVESPVGLEQGERVLKAVLDEYVPKPLLQFVCTLNSYDVPLDKPLMFLLLVAEVVLVQVLVLVFLYCTL